MIVCLGAPGYPSALFRGRPAQGQQVDHLLWMASLLWLVVSFKMTIGPRCLGQEKLKKLASAQIKTTTGPSGYVTPLSPIYTFGLIVMAPQVQRNIRRQARSKV